MIIEIAIPVKFRIDATYLLIYKVIIVIVLYTSYWGQKEWVIKRERKRIYIYSLIVWNIKTELKW